MPMLRITVTAQGAQLHGASTPLLPTLRRALAQDCGPIIVMVHGYKYAPGDAENCPHHSLFARQPSRNHARVISWPRHLGLRGQRNEGLGISFGWPARGTIWQAHRHAHDAGQRLAQLVADLRRLAPERPVHAVGHSLGARVILSAVAAGEPGAISRAVLLAAAEFGETARAILQSPQGSATEVLNVTSRENDLFDFLLERLVTPASPGDRMLGFGVAGLRNMVTLQLDDPRSLRALRRAGFCIAPPTRRICHWSPYLRPGVFPLYRAFFAGQMPLIRLHATLPEAPSRRWSRLLACKGGTAPAPLAAE